MNLSRRHFLAAAGGAAVLAACSDDDSSSSDAGGGNTAEGGNSTAATTGDTAAASGFALVQRFPNNPLFTPGEVRLPVSIADDTSMLNDGPDELVGWIEDFEGTKVVDVTGVRRKDGIPTAYWEVRADLAEAIIYTMRFEGDDGFGATFELFDPTDITTPLTGNPLPGFDTPTVDDHRGVEPYCSLTPDPCPLHDITLNEALALGTPVVYMVGTPAHCSTGTCTPGLEFLVEEHERVGDAIAMVHADVYADNAATTVAPAVEALDVSYEPIIYFCTADGTIVDRLDAIWDRGELRDRIDALLALN